MGPEFLRKFLAERSPDVAAAGPAAIEPELVRRGPLAFPPGYVCGTSAAMAEVYERMGHLAIGDLPVLVLGDTGSGKEMIARGLHLSSTRRGGPFVAINCAAIPAGLLEAELFGIGRGVAPGVDARPGKFQLARGGTLFLDEIGEMPPVLQAKLLRALERKEVSPVGSRPVAVDLRLIAASNAAMEERMAAGELRRDLYYRLAGAVLRLPPLRERREDVAALAGAFLHASAAEIGKEVEGITALAMRALVAYDWPGNVRELQHELRRLAYACPPGEAVTTDLLDERFHAEPEASRKPSIMCLAPYEEAPPAAPKKRFVDLPTLDLGRLEARAVREALKRCRDNQAEAAKLLGISRYALRRKLERLPST